MITNLQLDCGREGYSFIAPILKVIESQTTTGYTIYTYQKILIRQILKVLGNLLKRSLCHKCVVGLWEGGGYPRIAPVLKAFEHYASQRLIYVLYLSYIPKFRII